MYLSFKYRVVNSSTLDVLNYINLGVVTNSSAWTYLASLINVNNISNYHIPILTVGYLNISHW